MDADTLSQLVLLPALAFVCASDLLYRRIHNLLVLLLLTLWLLMPLSALFDLGPWATMSYTELGSRTGLSLFGAVLVLLVGIALFSLGRVGGGDVKLMMVLCLWMGPENQMAFLIVTSLAGGLLALALPLLAPLEQSLARGWMSLAQACPSLRIAPPTVLSEQQPSGIPYGLAITAGALYTLLGPIHS